ncbi:MAG: LysR family transcriptional regulator [Acidimicrobiales bacterium]
MELRHLQYFIAVAEERHFGRAAERLHIAQPALSQQIKRFETLIGAPLIKRTTRQVSLTPEGEALLPEARLTLSHAERAAQAVRQSIHGETGTIRIGFVSSAALSIVPRLTATIVELSPRIVVELTEITTDTQLEKLRTGDLDIGVVREVDEASGLTVQELVQEPLWLALHNTHRLADRRSVSIDELANEEFVMFPRTAVPRLYDHLTGLCWGAGFRMEVVQHAVQYATLIGLVAANIGISIVPDPICQLQLPAVRYIRIETEGAASRVSLAFPNTPEPSILTRRAIDNIAAEFQQVIP